MSRRELVTRERARLAREHDVPTAARMAGVSEIAIRRALRDAAEQSTTRCLLALLEPTEGTTR